MDSRKLEETLNRLADVEVARVVIANGKPTEIHVLARQGKAAKQLVRDVQSVALAGFGIEVDRRIVSVVQLDDGDLAAGDRPMVDDIAESINGSKSEITVTLTWHDQELRGNASGPASPTTRLRLVAEATISALQQALHEEAAFAIIGTATPLVGDQQIAIAHVVIVIGGTERHLVGSAFVSQDTSQAMVRAVLDALNRQVPGLRRTVS